MFLFFLMFANGRRLAIVRGTQMFARARMLESPTELSAGIHPALQQTACWRFVLFFHFVIYSFLIFYISNKIGLFDIS